ncbi:multiple epidermal growth factor-like domains protein 6 [Hydractinia symbiolongicarpus]|uniref:multiple epidermal growth factor-like domains protein 6 n=1 Tax=Hydractinia symbiolongicarpus TaxID=13093 RepID=UPI00254F6586|nr:multiple epidermal growth factor-like domains protein 6 [Hydractinia symbiolongicarpus]XP_057300157.1 multiple epidermal growth factor-like domains protein 6 [Hydractinia symbiolongicarpus]
MFASKLLFLLLVVAVIVQTDCWRRRRRRRSPPVCHRRNCVSSWGAWSACSCLNQRTRTLRIVSHPACGGAACPSVRRQIGTCYGRCTTGAGYCDVRSGRCRCNSGRTGSRCQSVCPKGRYGHNCARRCNCVAGISCDATKGYCKCPVGRSGRRCQFTYRCPRRNRCYTLKPTLVKYNHCYLQQRVGRRPVSSSCPRRTHYVNRCLCYNNCTPANMFNSRKCVCKCKAPRSVSVHSYYRGKYVTRAICCPRHPFF